MSGTDLRNDRCESHILIGNAVGEVMLEARGLGANTCKISLYPVLLTICWVST